MYSIFPEAEGSHDTLTGTKCNYNKEFFADKECHICGKVGHPARCCPQKKKGKAKKDLEGEKLVFSNKSAKTINSLTKQVKTLKKSVMSLQAIKMIVMATQVSPAKRETCIFNMHVQPLPLLIQRWPWPSSPRRHGIWISEVCGSWTTSQLLTRVATLISLTNSGTQKGKCTYLVMAVDCVSPRNVRFLVVIIGFDSLNGP